MNLPRLLFCLVLFGLSIASIAQTDKTGYRIYLDADQTHLRQAGLSILNGLRAALAEADNTLGGKPVEIVVKDHRRNTLRSQLHLKQLLNDPQALLVVGGVHSPPLLSSRDWMNQNRILCLNPWAAAGPITRAAPGHTNWIFRLSVDDTKAGGFMVEHMESRSLKRPLLLLEETKWGDTNLETIQGALSKADLNEVHVRRFPWHFGEAAASRLVNSIPEAKPDCILFVGNAPEAATIFTRLLKHPEASKLPVISHWGITAGEFWNRLPVDQRASFDLAFVQTAFSFISYPDDPIGKRTLERAADLGVTADMAAPVGFVHAYDLGKILLAAAEQAELTGEVQNDRERLRQALESLKKPVKGLVKTYRQPFRPWVPDDPDAHEALGRSDLAMATYDKGGRIRLLKAPSAYRRAP